MRFGDTVQIVSFNNFIVTKALYESIQSICSFSSKYPWMEISAYGAIKKWSEGRGGGTGGAQGARTPPVFWEKETKTP